MIPVNPTAPVAPMPKSDFDSNAVGLTANLDSEVGKFVIDRGLVTRTEVEFAREQQKQASAGSDASQRSLVDYLVEHNFLTVNQAKRIKGELTERRGSRIPGYQIIDKLGKGAMATVYKAKQVSLDRTVAVKILPRKVSNNIDFIERFYKEGRAAARLSHNNIVQAIDVGTTPDDLHYFVMEYVEGQTLYDVMQPPPMGRGQNFSEDEALDITIQIGQALAHAHKRGLIHRDVKPKNILLTPNGVAKLTDLGLARQKDDKQAAETEAGKAYGTPYYISPEQIRGEVDIDYRADIYSLGATMYHLVTGRPPFDGDTPSAVMHKHLKEHLIPPDHVNVALSAGISEIIEVAMAKDRKDRYASMEDMLEDLRAVRRGESPTHAREAVDLEALANVDRSEHTVDLEEAEPVVPWQNPAVVAILATGAVSLLVNLILAVWIIAR